MNNFIERLAKRVRLLAMNSPKKYIVLVFASFVISGALGFVLIDGVLVESGGAIMTSSSTVSVGMQWMPNGVLVAESVEKKGNNSYTATFSVNDWEDTDRMVLTIGNQPVGIIENPDDTVTVKKLSEGDTIILNAERNGHIEPVGAYRIRGDTNE